MTKTRLYSIQTHKNRVGFVSCSHVGSNFASPNLKFGNFELGFLDLDFQNKDLNFINLTF